MSEKINKHEQNEKYEQAINFLNKHMRLYSTDHLKLVVEAKQLGSVPDSRDWARVLRSGASRGLCKKTEIYQKSNFKNVNNIPRAMWAHPNSEVHG